MHLLQLANRAARGWLAIAIASSIAVTTLSMWPALVHGGALLSVDLVVMPTVPMPPALFWLGPDLGRRFPGFVPYALLGWITGGEIAGRIVLGASLIAIALGVARLTALLLSTTAGWPRRLLPSAAGIAVVLSPFVQTRMSTGHLTTLWAMATVPHVLCAAVSPDGSAARSRSCAVAGLTGFVSGAYSIVVVLVALTPRHRPAREIGHWTLRNLVWILPGIFLQMQGSTTMAPSTAFSPQIEDATTLLGLPVGLGYWDPVAESVRDHRGLLAMSCLILVALATVGVRSMTRHRGRVLTGCMMVGFGVPILAVLPGVSRVVAFLTRTPIGAPLREPHRLVGLGLVPLAAAAACGGVVLGGSWFDHATHRSPRRAIPSGLSLIGATVIVIFAALSLPVVHQRLTPMPVPASWHEAAHMVADDGGAVMVLPWSEYVELRLDRRRRVIHPLPDLFDGNVLASTDPLIGPPVNEAADPRAEFARRVAARLVAGEDASDGLRRLGVRWVAVLRVERLTDLNLAGQPALEPALSSRSLSLYRVIRPGAARFVQPVPPVGFQSGAGSSLDEPWIWGWWSGGTMLGSSSAGLLRGPGDRELALFLPALPAVAVFIGTVVLALRPRRSVTS